MLIETTEFNLQNTYWSEILKEVAVFYFHAPWCNPCKAFGKLINELALEIQTADCTIPMNFYKINVDEAPNLGKKYQIEGVPTLLLLKRGEPIDRINGMCTKQEIEERFKKALGFGGE